MTADITMAKAAWQIIDRALWNTRADHLRKPTRKSWKALVAAANRWEIAAITWSAMISTNGNVEAQRAEFVAATAVRLPTGRKPQP